MVTPPAAGCQPKDVTVTLPSDPDPSVLYYPSCVTAKRCGGCCMQDQHECGPTRVSKINNKVVKARYPYLGAPNFLFEGLVDVELDNHLECSCQCKNKPHHCDIAKHVYEAATCSCRCRNEDQRENCVAPQTWDNHKCACTCPALKYCQAHEYFSFSTCRCETSRDVVSDALSVGTVVDQVCVSTRCRANYVAMNIMGQCQCKMVSQWGDLAMANANARVTGLPLPTTPVPEVTTRRRRPGRRPRPSK
ncbi:hypothetical protein CAPTEDRAFT_220370 [Capitella teleta]|nr:hypothetical protein CAPTEDRAFT_220370 [Capitella teleta]|eukprot:ELU02884.1 hypothetical protein CAPTEDRAFT_220370 [Capitella teleta]